MSEAEASPGPKPLPRLGSYLLTEQLGSGGMSNVFRAVHEESGSVVAVKVLPRTLAKNVTLLQRFIREAKSAESLDHPNIVSIFDRGFDQGRHYLVLEFVEGRDLHDRVRLNGPMGVEESIRLVREVAEGLRYAAGRGMIHRDVKPANLLITPEGRAKIIDLGLALQTDDEDERVTRAGTTVGTVDYMAPEQARDSRRTSERSDIYSLGCTFYYLLTGSPPFPGGGLADKLARHSTAPVPDVRERRPEIPGPLALLVQKMMAKKPEGRFVDYSQLIAGLDGLSRTAAGPDAARPLDVLIDDDDDDSFGLAPPDPEPGRGRKDQTAEPTAPYLIAEILDDDDDQPPRPTLPAPARRSPASSNRLPAGKPRREPESAPEVSLAELAALDGDQDESPPRRIRELSGSSIKPGRAEASSLDALIDDDEPTEGASSDVRRGGKELPLQTWIAAGVMVGLALALVGFGVSLVISLSKPAEPEVVARPIEEPAGEASRDAVESSSPIAPRPGPNRPMPSPKVARKPEAINPATSPSVVVTPGVPAGEKAYPREWEARLSPPPTAADPAGTVRPRIILRRVAEAGDDPQTTSLAAALNRLGEVVEVADTGPFFEDDCQVSGKSRIIRARPGLRPMIKIELTGQPAVREQEAKFVLGGPRIEQLVFEGLDFSVDLRDLPIQQSALFLCRGAEVTLRDCSITLYNAGDRKFSLFRLLDGSRPNRLVLERTTIRGPIRTLVEVSGAKAEIILERSLVVGEAGPLIALDAAERPSRTLYLTRSLIATSGPLVEWSGKPSALAVRSLGSTLARVDAGPVAGLLHARSSSPGGPAAWLDWSGEDNTFVGWGSWLTAGPHPAAAGAEAPHRIADLDAVRSIWTTSDAGSREVPTPWPASVTREDLVPADLGPLAPDRLGTLAKIATPHARLRELTVDQIRRLPAPELADGLINRTPFAAPPSAIDVSFDVQALPWNGDLGRFLAETVKKPGSRAIVRVRGVGVHATSPVRLPDGVSVALLGDSEEGSLAPMPTFSPAPESVGQVLFDLRGGDLAVANLAFATDGLIRPKHWIRVEAGILAVRHCKFRDMGGVSPEVGAMIAFVATDAAPMPPKAGPLRAPTDFPTARLRNCLIWTGGDAIVAEVGRGVVDLDNCLLITGGPAISLLPAKVPSEKFEADLVLDHCTIADDRNAIALGPWPGDPAGPSRPWLVATRSCVFPRTQREGSTGSLLVADPAAFARGALFWHSNSDAYEIGRFITSSGAQPAGLPPAADLKKQWSGLWGAHHTRGDRGPNPRNNDHALRFKGNDRPKPGKVVPASLDLDPKVVAMRGLGVEFKDLPPPPSR